MLSHLNADNKRQTAKSITHFLLSQSKTRNFELVAPDMVAAEHGEKLFHTVGCVACHSPRNEAGKELLKETSVPYLLMCNLFLQDLFLFYGMMSDQDQGHYQ